MPKRPAGIPAETQRERFARRMAEEVTRRGWSDASLAKRVSDTYPMSASTVWKIKSEKQARGVSIDEATAIAVGAFGYGTIEAFLEDSPLEPLRSRLDGIGQALERQMRMADAALEHASAVKALLGEQPIMDALAARPEEARALAELARTWAVVWDAYLTNWRVVAETYRIAVGRMPQGGNDVQ